MQIHIDHNLTPKEIFSLSVPITDKESISFDYTTKGHRMTKQVLMERKDFPKNVCFDGEWDEITIKDGKFVKKKHIQWVDRGKIDWVNGEIWEMIWEKPISNDLTKRLLHYSQLISDHYQDLSGFEKDIKDFEKLLEEEIKKI